MGNRSVRWLRLCLPAFVLLAALAAARGGDDEIVAEFKKYFRQYKDTATRVEAVKTLEGADTPAVVEALAPVLKMIEEPDVVRAAIGVIAKFKNEAAKLAVFAELDANKDESVRVGLLQAMTLGKFTGANETLKKLLTDKAWDLRRRAAEALVASADATVGPALLPLCDDSEPAVRCAALEGLAALKDQTVLPHAIRSLGDDVWQVRSSAILALKRVRHRDSIGPLIARLDAEQGRLTVEIGDALNEVTGMSFGTRLDMWKQFWANASANFQIPSDEQLAKLRAKQKEEAAKYKAKEKGTTYHGIETPSRRIMFVIDVSGSMENLVVEKERFEDGGYPSMLRIDICKTELVRTIEALEDYVDYNVIAYATGVKQWKKDLVKANVINKSSAVDWVRRLEAIGGASKEDLAQAGLTNSAALDQGKTNTFGALSAALGAGGRGTKDKAYECDIDTIFFLSDGRPTVGLYVDPNDVLREVKELNKLRKVVIHTIAIGEFQKDFMKTLAEDNGGVFVDLGR
jgi:hypothetical protein